MTLHPEETRISTETSLHDRENPEVLSLENQYHGQGETGITLQELPVLEHLVESPSGAALETELRSKLDQLMKLSHQDLLTKLAQDGFTNSDITRLDAIVSTTLDETQLAEQLAAMLSTPDDVLDTTQVETTLHQWMNDIAWETAIQHIVHARLPDPISAIAYVTHQVRHIAASTLWFEATRQDLYTKPQPEHPISEAHVEEGITLAEAGLNEETAEWPAY